MSQPIEKLEAMIGRPFMLNNEQVVIQEYKIKGERIHLHTTLGSENVLFSDLRQHLKQYLPIAKEKSLAISNTPPTIVNSGIVNELKDILMDNIEKIKADKNYIPQATAINQNVNSMIDLAKTEILMKRTGNNS